MIYSFFMKGILLTFSKSTVTVLRSQDPIFGRRSHVVYLPLGVQVYIYSKVNWFLLYQGQFIGYNLGRHGIFLPFERVVTDGMIQGL